MKRLTLLRLFIIIFLICITNIVLKADKVDNEVEIKATIVDYTYIADYNDDDGVGGWHGIYKFTVEGKDYTFTGKISYNPKIIVLKSTKVLYNENNPSEFKEKTPSILLIVSLITIAYNVYMLIKSFLVEMKHYFKSKFINYF